MSEKFVIAAAAATVVYYWMNHMTENQVLKVQEETMIPIWRPRDYPYRSFDGALDPSHSPVYYQEPESYQSSSMYYLPKTIYSAPGGRTRYVSRGVPFVNYNAA